MPPQSAHQQLNEVSDPNIVNYQTQTDHVTMPTEHVPTVSMPIRYDMNAGAQQHASNVMVNQTTDQNACEIEQQIINTIPDTSSVHSQQEIVQVLHQINQSSNPNEPSILQSHAQPQNIVQAPNYPATTAQVISASPIQVVGQPTTGLVPQTIQQMQPIQPTPQTIQPQSSQVVSTSVSSQTNLISQPAIVSQPIQNVQSIPQTVQSQPIPQPQPQPQQQQQQQQHQHQQQQQQQQPPLSQSQMAMPQPIEQDPSQQQQPQSQVPVTNTTGSGTNVVPSTKSAQSCEGKTRRSNKSSERIPKLVILSVHNGTLVDCSMESKLKTIKFKFDISDVNPVDVANDLVSFCVEKEEKKRREFAIT